MSALDSNLPPIIFYAVRLHHNLQLLASKRSPASPAPYAWETELVFNPVDIFLDPSAKLVEAHNSHTFQQSPRDTSTCVRVIYIPHSEILSAITSCEGVQEVHTAPSSSGYCRLRIPAGSKTTEMATQQSTRIWENDSSAPAPHRTSQPHAATLPSIATLTNELPPGANGQPSPIYPTNRSSDQWATPPQSSRKLHIPPLSYPVKAPIGVCTTWSYFAHPSCVQGSLRDHY